MCGCLNCCGVALAFGSVSPPAGLRSVDSHRAVLGWRSCLAGLYPKPTSLCTVPWALEFMRVWHQKSWTFQINSTGKESGRACFPGRDTFPVQAAAAAMLPLNHFFLSKGVFQPAASPGQAGLCLRLCDNILSTGSGPFSAVLPGCGEISRDGNSRFRLHPLLAL